MINLKFINTQTFDDFMCILAQRGTVDKSYYSWKYMNELNKDLGFIMYYENQPCACIGCIKKIFVDEKGIEHTSFWFADWWVDPKFRAQRLGVGIMTELFNSHDFVFGITNPLPAQKIANKVGYITRHDLYLTKFTVKLSKLKYNNLKGFIKFNFNFFISKLSLFSLIFQPKFRIRLVDTGKEICDFIGNEKVNGAFKKDENFYNWLIAMPNRNNKWFLCNDNEDKFILRIIDYNNITTMQVIDSTIQKLGKDNYQNCMRKFIYLTYKLKTDAFESFDVINKDINSIFFKINSKWQPFQYKLNNDSQSIKHICIADKESSWAQIKISHP